MNPSRPLEGTNNTVVLKSFVQLFWRASSLLLEDFKWNVMAKPTRWLIAWEIDVCLAEEGVLVMCSPLNPDHKEKPFTPLHPPLIKPILSPRHHLSRTCTFTSNTSPLSPLRVPPAGKVHPRWFKAQVQAEL